MNYELNVKLWDLTLLIYYHVPTIYHLSIYHTVLSIYLKNKNSNYF